MEGETCGFRVHCDLGGKFLVPDVWGKRWFIYFNSVFKPNSTRRNKWHKGRRWNRVQTESSHRDRGVQKCFLLPELANLIHYIPTLLYVWLNVNSLFLFQCNSKVTRNQLQLVGVTALYVAAKYEEVCTPTMQDFSAVSDNAFSTNDVSNMEVQMLKALSYDLAAPQPVFFLRRFSKAAKVRFSKLLFNWCLLWRQLQLSVGI